jgi:CheY-like chemotaxis protein
VSPLVGRSVVAHPAAQSAKDWLVGGGEMAKVIRATDWSKTTLGPMESWPQSLRTTVSLVQASNSPISLSWGSGHVQIYNDGYWPLCGDKHPGSMGQDFRECWATAFPVIGDAYESAWSGKGAYLENVRMFLDRYGFLEETWSLADLQLAISETGAVITRGDLPLILAVKALQDGRLANTVSVAKDGEDAMNYLHRRPPYEQAPRPDLVLLDLNLPKMDGREVLTAIKADATLRRIPIVVLTSSAAERDIAESYELKANFYVTKPVDTEQFMAVVSTLEQFWLEIGQLPR